MKSIVEALPEDAALAEKEKSFDFSKEALKRPGVILRLVSFGLVIVGIVLTLVLPTVNFEYASYTSTTILSTDQINAFPDQLISGFSAMFGGGMYAYYSTLNATSSTVLTAGTTNFNPFMLAFMLFGIAGIVLGFFITFSKKMEKWSKLAILFIVLAGIGVLASPIWFIAVNGLSYYSMSQQLTGGTGNITHYLSVDEIYIHCAYGAIVAMIFFVAAAICFGVGTSLENKGGEGRGGNS